MAQRIYPSTPQYQYWGFVPPKRSNIIDSVIYTLIIH
jgi:hypothetical protein